jgi:hypothetical protein
VLPCFFVLALTPQLAGSASCSDGLRSQCLGLALQVLHELGRREQARQVAAQLSSLRPDLLLEADHALLQAYGFAPTQ